MYCREGIELPCNFVFCHSPRIDMKKNTTLFYDRRNKKFKFPDRTEVGKNTPICGECKRNAYMEFSKFD